MLELYDLNATVEKIGNMFLFRSENGIEPTHSMFAVQNIFHIQIKNNNREGYSLVICSKERSYDFGFCKNLKYTKANMKLLIDWISEQDV